MKKLLTLLAGIIFIAGGLGFSSCSDTPKHLKPSPDGVIKKLQMGNSNR